MPLLKDQWRYRLLLAHQTGNSERIKGRLSITVRTCHWHSHKIVARPWLIALINWFIRSSWKWKTARRRREIYVAYPFQRLGSFELFFISISLGSVVKKTVWSETNLSPDISSTSHSQLDPNAQHPTSYMSYLPDIPLAKSSRLVEFSTMSVQSEAINALRELKDNRHIFERANILRYRENVFRAASRLTKGVFMILST